ncbi:MAG: hypothetical protein KGM24_11145, partial [Elusimicrobia bacterium]|nr:hypothetical protein [Elusimicrobiota bacterium]
AAALLAASALPSDAASARGAFSRRAPAYARVSAWIDATLPADARLESWVCQPLALLSGRPVVCPVAREPREAWIADLLRDGVGWVHEGARWSPDGFFPPAQRRFAREREAWLEDPRYFRLAYEDPADGAVYRLALRDPARFRRAWRAFEEAAAALRRGDRRTLDARLRETTRLDPGFANAWAMRALLQKDPRRALALTRRAAAADPASDDIRAQLAALERAAARASARHLPASAGVQ